MDKVAELLNDSGAHVREVELPKPFDSIWATAELIQYAEAGQINESLAKENPSKISAVTQALVLKGLNITMVDYVKARRIQQELIAEFSIFMKGFDALLTMPATGEAPHGLNDTVNNAERKSGLTHEEQKELSVRGNAHVRAERVGDGRCGLAIAGNRHLFAIILFG
jgi:Asp-tRNA(Asn)/Glu-tRNA(Gln) amidotransferase A subunit family amidase